MVARPLRQEGKELECVDQSCMSNLDSLYGWSTPLDNQQGQHGTQITASGLTGQLETNSAQGWQDHTAPKVKPTNENRERYKQWNDLHISWKDKKMDFERRRRRKTLLSVFIIRDQRCVSDKSEVNTRRTGTSPKTYLCNTWYICAGDPVKTTRAYRSNFLRIKAAIMCWCIIVDAFIKGKQL